MERDAETSRPCPLSFIGLKQQEVVDFICETHTIFTPDAVQSTESRFLSGAVGNGQGVSDDGHLVRVFQVVQYALQVTNFKKLIH